MATSAQDLQLHFQKLRLQPGDLLLCTDPRSYDELCKAVQSGQFQIPCEDVFVLMFPGGLRSISPHRLAEEFTNGLKEDGRGWDDLSKSERCLRRLAMANALKELAKSYGQ